MSYEVFKCPNCQQFISTKQDACRFCSFQLNDDIKAKAIMKEADDTRQYRRNMHKKVLYVGLGIFAIGAVLSIATFITLFVSGSGFYFPWSPVIVLFGLGQMLIGLLGIIGERKK
ncbi:MAG: hypothetical protein M3033_05125 [Acidobacteriota bacterium]|nr:hypothetical protein [Acidobacteriota bacterium]